MQSLSCGKAIQHCGVNTITYLYPRLTRTHTVLTGGKAPIHPQSPCQYTKYCLRSFRRLTAFLLRQNCSAPNSDVFSSDFWLLRRRCVVTHQGEKGKKRRKDTLLGVYALVNRGYYYPIENFDSFRVKSHPARRCPQHIMEIYIHPGFASSPRAARSFSSARFSIRETYERLMPQSFAVSRWVSGFAPPSP